MRKQLPHHERHSGDASGGGGPPLGDCPRPSDVDLGATMAVWRGREIRDAGSRQKRETSSLDKWKCKVNQREGPRKQEAGQQKGVLRAHGSQVACPG